ncbi:glycoside hydrolase family 61 protein [Rhizoctonia solani 123E]|uniref:lytic cellulose monooxygenase (C4-dehydrogenating) n=1 Tax=Rhizoctonia solani 123E TaxID=1423351 RepID=A0A074RM12_9AGAM|nr:glycoside hydrolase family 61 protein [Rhizoctonia solani 123E]
MNTWPADHKGPMLVYMANCGDSCDNFDGSGNVWFKVSSEGLIDAASFYWGSDKLIAQGNSWTQVIPSNIKAGKYLMRFELLALHPAGSPQFYPSCTQLDITGGVSGAPTQSELVSIPGVYQQGDQRTVWQYMGTTPVVASSRTQRRCVYQRRVGSCSCSKLDPGCSYLIRRTHFDLQAYYDH